MGNMSNIFVSICFPSAAGESGKDMAKDIVSSVLSAANRKLKGKSSNKDLLSAADDGSDHGNFGFDDRTTESTVRAVRLQNQEADRSKGVVTASPPVVAAKPRRDSQSSLASTVTESEGGGTAYSSDVESLANAQSWSGNRQQQSRHQIRMHHHHRQARTAVDRKLSASSEASDTSSEQYTSSSSSAYVQQLISLESHAQRGSRRGIIIQDGDWQSEFTRERERIEIEHAMAVRDYETEDNTNIEELYKSKNYLKEISVVSNKIAEFASSQDNENNSGAPEQRLPLPDSLSVTSDYSTTSSSNNNNTLQEARSNASSSPRRELMQNSPSPLDDESDFVQAMKATFDERLQKVLKQESLDESNASFDTRLHNDLEKNLQDISPELRSRPTSRRSSPMKRETSRNSRSGSLSESRLPLKAVTPSDICKLANTLCNMRTSVSDEPLSSHTDQQSNINTPGKSPRKFSSIEVHLIMEKRESTPTSTLRTPAVEVSEAENIDPNGEHTRQVPKRRQQSKDTLSIKQKRRDNRRRRHTVAGGGNGIPEYSELMKYYFGNENSSDGKSAAVDARQQSAFDRLKPFGKETKGSEVKDLTTWLKSERVRNSNSSPDLAVSTTITTNNAKGSDRTRSIPAFDVQRSSAAETRQPLSSSTREKPRYYEIESYI